MSTGATKCMKCDKCDTRIPKNRPNTLNATALQRMRHSILLKIIHSGLV